MKVDSGKKSSKLVIDSTKGTAPIDEQYTEGYSQDIIDLAMQYKGSYGSKYSDEFYLQYASRALSISSLKVSASHIAGNAANLAIQDPEWAGYSYEEIIQMENNGYKIPQEVLLWAHAQAESDVTSYQCVTDSSTADDGSTDQLNAESDINTILANAQKYIIKAEKAEEEIKAKTEEFEVVKNKALQIKKDNEDSFKEASQKMSKMKQEWDDLNKKAKEGSLTSTEEKRYNEISKLISTDAKKNVSSNQSNVEALDELFATMNGLNDLIEQDNALVEDIKQVTSNLGNMDKSYNDNQKKHTNKAIAPTNDGLLAQTLFGLFGPAAVLQKAYKAGEDLGKNVTELDENANSSESIEVVGFAEEYKASIDEQKELAEKVDGNGTDKSSAPKVNNNPLRRDSRGASSNKGSNYTADDLSDVSSSASPVKGIAKGVSTATNIVGNVGAAGAGLVGAGIGGLGIAANGLFSAIGCGGILNPLMVPSLVCLCDAAVWKSLSSIAETTLAQVALEVEQANIKKTLKTIQKDMKKTNQEMKKLLSEYKSSSKKHEKIVQSYELTGNKFNELQEQELRRNEEMQAEEESQNDDEKSSGAKQNKKDDNNSNLSEMSNLAGQMQASSMQDKMLTKKMDKNIKARDAMVRKTQQNAQKLTTKNENFKAQNKENKKIANKAMITGGATAVVAGTTALMSSLQQSAAQPLLSNPFTAALGAAIIALDVVGIAASISTGIIGATSTLLGGVGRILSNVADGAIKDTNSGLKDISGNINDNNKELRDMKKDVKNWDKSEAPRFMFSPSDNNNNDSKSSGSGFKGVPGNDSAPAASPEVAKSVTPNIPSLNNNANTGIAPQNQGADNNALPAQPKEDKKPQGVEAKQSVVKFENSNNETPKSIDEIAQQKSNKQQNSAQQKPQEANAPQERVEKKSPLVKNAEAKASKAVSNPDKKKADKQDKNKKQDKAVAAQSNEQKMNQKLANEKNDILGELRAIERDSKSAESSSDKVDALLKNNAAKSKLLKQQFDGLNADVQNIKIDEKNAKSVKTLQKDFERDANEVDNIVVVLNNKASKSTVASDENLEDEKDINKDDMISIVNDAIGEKEQEKVQEEELAEDTNILAASASTNVNAAKDTVTDDKADRKLARFNNDSIIESKKKRKKVQAVSASSNKKA